MKKAFSNFVNARCDVELLTWKRKWGKSTMNFEQGNIFKLNARCDVALLTRIWILENSQLILNREVFWNLGEAFSDLMNVRCDVALLTRIRILENSQWILNREVFSNFMNAFSKSMNARSHVALLTRNMNCGKVDINFEHN